eukprot:13140027-Alexandrium_andersonii.AAC.1
MRAAIRPSSASSIGSSYVEAVSIASPTPSVSSRAGRCELASSTKALPEAPFGGPSTRPEAPVGGPSALPEAP